MVQGTILTFGYLQRERESCEASVEGLDGSIRWLKLQSLETPRLFLTLLWLRESSLLDKHMAGYKMGPAGPVNYRPQSGDEDAETAGSGEREMSDRRHFHDGEFQG